MTVGLHNSLLVVIVAIAGKGVVEESCLDRLSYDLYYYWLVAMVA